jgi:hypothetical protein
MRSFKEMRRVINESHNHASYASTGWRGRIGPMDSQNSLDFNQNLTKLMPNEIDRINTYLGAISAKPYINPDEAFKEIWNTFHSIGLNFTPTKGDSLRVEGDRVYELDLFGGYFGSDGSTYDYTKENMIERKLGHRLGLMISSKKTMEGATNLAAKIVPL